MALIACKHCGGNVSDKAKNCPHCGESLIEEEILQVNEPEVAEPEVQILCEECGAVLTEEMTECPNCGCPVEAKQEPAEEPAAATSEAAAVKTKKSPKMMIIAAVALVAVLIAFFAIRSNTLTGDSKIAYELVLEAADNFKNPSSVRLVSGTLGVDKDCLFAGISATNGFGARSTGYYFVMDGWVLEEEEDINYLYTSKEDLNFDLINKKLEEALGY